MNAAAQPSVVIIGSFGRHLPQIMQVATAFQQNGLAVLSPPGIESGFKTIPSPSDDFLVLEADQAKDAKGLQDDVISKMHRVSFVYWVNPDGYVGESAAWEMGNANSIRREDGSRLPVYAMCRPQNATLSLYLAGVHDPLELCERFGCGHEERMRIGVKHLFFDIDNTLIDDQGLLLSFQGEADRLLPGFNCQFNHFQSGNIPADGGNGYGYGNMSYAASFVETFYSFPFWQRRRNQLKFKNIVSRLIKARNSVPRVMDGVPETLAELQARNHVLHVLSRGRRREQVEKLVQADLHKFFSGIHIVDDKGPDTYARIAGELELSAADCWMIGDSLTCDVMAPLRVGWQAVHVGSGTSWISHELDMLRNDVEFKRFCEENDQQLYVSSETWADPIGYSRMIYAFLWRKAYEMFADRVFQGQRAMRIERFSDLGAMFK